MDPKKLTRIFFYALGAALGLTVLSLLILIIIQEWAHMWPLAVAISAGLLLTGLFKLAEWAFSPEPYKYESDFPRPEKTKTSV